MIFTDTQSTNDYYPFGSRLPGRGFDVGRYKFGFNGQEKDNEITGIDGTHTTAMFWEYDSRIGRRWNMDPKPIIGMSSYSCFMDNPIKNSDRKGDIIDPTDEESKKAVDQTFSNTFGESSEMANVLMNSYNSETKKFSNINEKAYNKAYKGLKDDVLKAKANAIKGVISNTKVVGVDAAKKGTYPKQDDQQKFRSAYYNVDEASPYAQGAAFYENELNEVGVGQNRYIGIIGIYYQDPTENVDRTPGSETSNFIYSNDQRSNAKSSTLTLTKVTTDNFIGNLIYNYYDVLGDGMYPDEKAFADKVMNGEATENDVPKSLR